MSGGIRFGGLASGMDTQAIVDKMMAAKRVKADRYTQERFTHEYKIEQYQDINKAMANFILESRKGFEIQDSFTFLGQLRPNAIDRVDWAYKTTVSNENVFTATATAGSQIKNLDLEVVQLAKKASTVGATMTGIDASSTVGENMTINLKVNDELKTVKIESTDTIKEALGKISKETGLSLSFAQVGVSGDGKKSSMLFMSSKESGSNQKIEFGINGGPAASSDEDTFKFFNKIGLSNDVMQGGLKGQDSIVKMNGAGAINGIATKEATAATFVTDASMMRSGLPALSDTYKVFNSSTRKMEEPTSDFKISLNVNGEDKEATIKAGATNQDVLDAFKSMGLKIETTVDPATNNVTSYSISSGKKGSSANIETTGQNYVNTVSALKSVFGINPKNVADGVKGTDGVAATGEIVNSSNNINIGGINVNLKSEGTSKVEIKADVDGIYDKIKNFVEKYNEMIDKLNKKLSEEKDKDYKPLLPEQRESMKEKEVELWDEKAKKGLLYNDQTITKVLNDISNTVYEKVDGAYAIYEIGITTTKNWKEGPKLQIDEVKLKEAIANDPEGVLNTILKSSDDMTDYSITSKDTAQDRLTKAEKAKKQEAETGVFNRLMNKMTEGIASIIKESGHGNDVDILRKVKNNITFGVTRGQSVLEMTIDQMNKKINNELDYLKRYEDSLWKRFTAMEKAVQQAQSQSSWLAGQLG